MADTRQTEQMTSGKGFVAALDQSGGSTPKALKLYGVDESAYGSESEMYDLIHKMRSRIITSPVFSGEHIVGAILFEQTMDRDIDGIPTAQYLWEKRSVVPFLKIDKGLLDEADGVRLMKPMPGLDDLLDRAVSKGIFGTKMRSVIDGASASGIAAIVAQQFEIAGQVLAKGLIPIIEPEITITISAKAEAEAILLAELTKHVDAMPADQQVILKLTLPETANTYASLVDHPRVMRVVALSGGYSRDEANARLSVNHGVIASFSRALTEGLSAGQPDAAFNEALGDTITRVYTASVAG
ncbi:fructose bisphosphate aldolase [Sedimentitalea todarodis]|uniref:fructose-bisphosphate aldolase n=1 Tax=Sedimentitalea todarodis TaxID=1631240 RepID=A0ABU3VCG4_9RHOB|nr:fructose bisphosphate aldolase [Sedimentitalea todarodis]MDU9003878.1 fructose bisphosphate aldolase [Sedimentitalea todarodis]